MQALKEDGIRLGVGGAGIVAKARKEWEEENQARWGTTGRAESDGDRRGRSPGPGGGGGEGSRENEQ